MTCPACSATLPPDANFCSRCGASLQAVDEVSKIRREICEIVRSGEEGNWFRAGDTYWEAIAVGPQGRYTAARSETCPRLGSALSRGIKRADVLLDQLIAKLTQEGWQPIPRGPEWYSYRFERYSSPPATSNVSPDDQSPAPAAGSTVS